MSLPYVPGQRFEGEVIYIYPYLDKKTREVQVRLEFNNPTNLLKPGMFANVTLENTLAAEKTLAPRSAVIDTGERQVAFVSRGEGKFEPRDVRLGVETGDGMVEIISGLKPGEMVVTSGQFLIDSEAKMREALAKMIRGDLASEQQVTADTAGASELQELPGGVAAKLNQALKHYLAMAEVLANDTTQNVAGHAEQLATSLDELIKLEVPADPHLWHKHQDAIATARSNAFKLINTTDLAEARLQFAQISTSLETLLMVTGVPSSFEREVQVLHCPMYRKDQGGQIWLQPAGDVRNPYMGQRMLECFDERKALPVTGGSTQTRQPKPDQSGSTDSDAVDADHAEHEPATQATDDYPIDFCLVSGEPLGSMGAPVTLEYEGRTLKFCCESCIKAFQKNPDEYLKKLDEAAKTLGKTQGGR
jgi:YHS domain-containing protein